jgi:hypothetical protein
MDAMALDDHVKRGKKLLPPIMAAGHPIELGNWPLDRVPEFFWLALMVERFGRRETLDCVTRMTKAIHSTINNIRSEFTVIRAYLLSEHQNFSETERKKLVSVSRRSKWFQRISPFVAELLVIWPELPAGYLAIKKSPSDKAKLTEEIKNVLSRFLYRHDELADLVQAIVAIAEIRSGHVGIAQGLEWPNFDAIIDDPGSDEAKHAAGFAVATCSQLNRFGRDMHDLSWNRSFWNRCYRLQPCEYDYE